MEILFQGEDSAFHFSESTDAQISYSIDVDSIFHLQHIAMVVCFSFSF